MILNFLGTKGYIDTYSKFHARHTALLVSYKGKKILFDYGKNWKKEIFSINPKAVFLTHGHPDHAYGLKNGSPCPVYATKETFDKLDFPIKEKKIVKINQLISLYEIKIEAFELIHSISAPAVGYKISAGRKKIFFAPDVVWINKRGKAFKNINIYIGDGATIDRQMIRKKNRELFGHANIKTQLAWCEKENAKKMIITHCGSQIVKNHKKAKKKIKKLAEKKEIKVVLAVDGMRIKV